MYDLNDAQPQMAPVGELSRHDTRASNACSCLRTGGYAVI
jgi:hypothetical protein